MIKNRKIILSSLVAFILLGFCMRTWSEEDEITKLQKKISDLEEQKDQLETEKGKLVAEGDELSLKIDSLKIQAKGGLGIIGRFKLSRSLRKAQSLSDEIHGLEKRINKIDEELKDKKKGLIGKYDQQIICLMEKLEKTDQPSEKGEILEKVEEYQSAKKKLVEPEEELERFDIDKIEINEYDGPQEIREKADLINDFANKLKDRIDMMKARAEKLDEEFRTRQKLGEFAEEISFFGERISREEVVSDSGSARAVEEKSTADNVDEPEVLGTDDKQTPTVSATDSGTIERGTEANVPEPETTSKSGVLGDDDTPEIQQADAPSKMVIERNGVSASFTMTSLEQIKREMELLKKQEGLLKAEMAVLMEKANAFYKKADEIEKSETKKGVQKEAQK